MATMTDDGLIFFHDCRPSSQLAVLGYSGNSNTVTQDYKFRYIHMILYRRTCTKHVMQIHCSVQN